MFTISFNNCDSNKKCDQLNKFVAEVNDLLAHVTSEEVVSLEDAEVHVSKTFRSLAQMFLEVCVSEQAGEKVGEWSADLSVPEQVDTQTLRDNERWSVSCDGCRTNSPDGWKETKVGCVYRDYPQLGSGAAPSARTESIRYVAERENAEQFGFKLFALATQSGIYRDAIDTQEIVFIWDGAAWIWNLAADLAVS